MGRPRRAEGRNTREAILSAALDLFAANGYFGTSLRDIAQAVGIRESAIYNHFAGKDALFDALVATEQESRLERLTAVLQGPIEDIHAVLTDLVVAVLDSFATPRQEQLFRMFMADGIRLAKGGRINLVGRFSFMYARLRDLMQRLVDEGWLAEADPDVLTLDFMGPMFLWRFLNSVRPDHPAVVDRHAFARGHADNFLRGAGVAPASRGARRHAAPHRPSLVRRGSRANRGHV